MESIDLQKMVKGMLLMPEVNNTKPTDMELEEYKDLGLWLAAVQSGGIQADQALYCSRYRRFIEMVKQLNINTATQRYIAFRRNQRP